MRFKKSFALVITISLLATGSWASVAPGKANLIMRQPLKVSASAKNGVVAQNRLHISAAIASAEKLDRRIPVFLEAASLGTLQRWRMGVNLNALEQDYNRDLMKHIAAMTDVLRSRREQRGFKKWQEFEFRNLLAKSDYILAVPMTRQSLSAQKNFLNAQKMLLEYNRERLYFDGQKISL